MKSLIIGAAGFVGKHLIDHLKNDKKWVVVATKLPHEKIYNTDIDVYDVNILDIQAVKSVIIETQPDFVFHLAAQSSVALSWKEPTLTVDININGCVNLLDAIRQTSLNPRILLIGSGEEYGQLEPDEVPISEESRLHPGNIYAATKVCQNMIGKIYADAYNMDIMMVRAFNHIGPGQAPQFVVSDFCKQVAEIESDKMEATIYVGNLSAKRDFTDVRDVVCAYSMLLEKGKKAETYNVGSGHAVSIQSILETILGMSDKNIKIIIDEKKFRPVDVPIIEANIEKISICTGWLPKITLEETINETLEYWRKITL